MQPLFRLPWAAMKMIFCTYNNNHLSLCIYPYMSVIKWQQCVLAFRSNSSIQEHSTKKHSHLCLRSGYMPLYGRLDSKLIPRPRRRTDTRTFNATASLIYQNINRSLSWQRSDLRKTLIFKYSQSWTLRLIFTARCKARYCYRKSSVRPSICLSVTLTYREHIAWTSSKLITRIISLGSSLLGATTSPI